MLHNVQFMYNIKQQNGDTEHSGSCDSASGVIWDVCLVSISVILFDGDKWQL
jgi:hypothetical protein